MSDRNRQSLLKLHIYFFLSIYCIIENEMYKIDINKYK